jgi:putative ABC transport system ATP-binding protein
MPTITDTTGTGTSQGGSTEAVALSGVWRTYRSRSRRWGSSGEVHALQGVTHAFAAGSFTAIMGPSGSGKSTLLQVAAGLDRPTRGEVLFTGGPGTNYQAYRLERLDQSRLTKLRRTSMGFIFQSYNLLDALTAYENVALPTRLAGARVDRAAVRAALHQVGIAELARRRPPELSGGQQQRVAIARALHNRPAVVFADEPTGALDRATGRQVLELLGSLTGDSGVGAAGVGQTVIMVTHDPLAASYAHTTLFLTDGQIAGRLDHGGAAEIAAAMNELER